MMSRFFEPKFTLPPSVVTLCHKIHDPPSKMMSQIHAPKEKNEKCDVTNVPTLPPSHVTVCHIFSTPSSLGRDIIYG